MPDPPNKFSGCQIVQKKSGCIFFRDAKNFSGCQIVQKKFRDANFFGMQKIFGMPAPSPPPYQPPVANPTLQSYGFHFQSNMRRKEEAAEKAEKEAEGKEEEVRG